MAVMGRRRTITTPGCSTLVPDWMPSPSSGRRRQRVLATARAEVHRRSSSSCGSSRPASGPSRSWCISISSSIIGSSSSSSSSNSSSNDSSSSNSNSNDSSSNCNINNSSNNNRRWDMVRPPGSNSSSNNDGTGITVIVIAVTGLPLLPQLQLQPRVSTPLQSSMFDPIDVFSDPPPQRQQRRQQQHQQVQHHRHNNPKPSPSHSISASRSAIPSRGTTPPPVSEIVDNDDVLCTFTMSVEHLTSDGSRLSAADVLDIINKRTDEVITLFLPCVEFLVQCQQELRTGLAAANRKRYHQRTGRYVDCMTPRQVRTIFPSVYTNGSVASRVRVCVCVHIL